MNGLQGRFFLHRFAVSTRDGGRVAMDANPERQHRQRARDSRGAHEGCRESEQPLLFSYGLGQVGDCERAARKARLAAARSRSYRCAAGCRTIRQLHHSTPPEIADRCPRSQTG
eukprot:7377333-Prymnesium_polylepis.1